MHVIFQLNEVIFEWDSVKNLKNMEKHGLSFERAAEAFFQRFSDYFDEDNSDFYYNQKEIIYSEERRNLIGFTNNGLFIKVTYTEINNHIRIISARKVK